MSDEPDDLRPELSRVENRLSGVEQAVDRLDESVSGVEEELRNLRGAMNRGFDGTTNRGSEGADRFLSDMHRSFDRQRRLLFLFGLYATVLLVLAELL